MSIKQSIEFLIYGSAAIAGMKYLDMTIAKYIGNKYWIYLIMAIVFTATASKVASWITIKVGSS